jgi:tRNA-specific adenosine deaminase 1
MESRSSPVTEDGFEKGEVREGLEKGVVDAVLQIFNSIPANGKPQLSEEFTILAGIVALVDGVRYRVLSLATGTKCVGLGLLDEEGRVLHDSHAEVLAKRGFQRYLLRTLRHLKVNPSFIDDGDCILMLSPSSSDSNNIYQQRSNWQLYLYSSDSPCGDASIYPTITGEANFTGAKLVMPLAETSDVLVHDNGLCHRETSDQALGSLRTKTGRSDIADRSCSMSCSDKICRWITLGLQG